MSVCEGERERERELVRLQWTVAEYIKSPDPSLSISPTNLCVYVWEEESVIFTMKHCVLLSLLLALGFVHVRGAPVEQAALEQASCEDPFSKAAAGLALTKINKDRREGYIFSLHGLSNVHIRKHVSPAEHFVGV